MGKITFIVGGARSGKSQYAVEVAGKKHYKRIAFIATCEAKDDEMTKRIALHKKARPGNWKTFEEPCFVSSLTKRKDIAGYDMILLDCLTLQVTNLLLSGLKEARILSEIKKMISGFRKIKPDIIIVSNEVGLGIVPEGALSRDFRDIAGRVNQFVASQADEVVFMVSGIPWRIK